MAYIPYPQAPTAPNGYQVLGQALTQGAGQIQDSQDRDLKMRQSMAEMTEKRANAILARQEAELRAKQLEQDTRLKSEADQRAHDFAIEAAKGKATSPTLAKDPSLARRSPAPVAPTVPGQPTAAELADLSNVQGMNIPAQPVKAGGDATAMMGEALDRQPMESPEGRTPYDRQGLADLALQTRQMDAKDYMAATKPDPSEKKHNPALMAQYYGEFLPMVAPLLKRLKNDPTVVSDIAYMGETQGLGQLEEYQKFIDNLKGGQPWNAATGQRLDLATKGQTFQQENALRDEYNKKTATFETAFTAFKKLSQALERNNPADAYSAIINYVRTLDPGSTVREAEERLARERASGGPLGAFGQYLSNLKDGTLTDPIRKNLLAAGRGLVGAEHDSYQQVRKDYGGRVEAYNGRGYGLDPEAVLGTDYTPQYQQLMGRDIFNPGKPAAAPTASPAAPRPPSASAGIPAKGNRKALGPETVADYLKRAGGDRQKAKQMLAKDGYNING